jgi:hypothetical protein
MPQDLGSPDLGYQEFDSQNLDPLILDLLEWIAREPRSYTDVLDAWRTSCPRLTVWEDAIDRGFATRKYITGHPASVELTSTGLAFLQAHRRFVLQAQAAAGAVTAKGVNIPAARRQPFP